jgi:aspartate/methionine/tyrosine aminotransferase
MPNFNNFKDKLKNKYSISTSQEFTDLCLKEAKVAMLPGSDFYFDASEFRCRVASVDYDGASVYSASLSSKKLDDEFVETNCPNLKNGLVSLENFLNEL